MPGFRFKNLFSQAHFLWQSYDILSIRQVRENLEEEKGGKADLRKSDRSVRTWRKRREAKPTFANPTGP
jgi:hypothetical protein